MALRSSDGLEVPLPRVADALTDDMMYWCKVESIHTDDVVDDCSRRAAACYQYRRTVQQQRRCEKVAVLGDPICRH